MNEISIVKRHSRLVPILLAVLVAAILILAALWTLGTLVGVPPARLDVYHVIDFGGAWNLS